MKKEPKTALKIFSEIIADRALPQFRTYGFSNAAFLSVFHGKETQGHFYPMVRIVGHRFDLIDITLASAAPNMALIYATTCFFAGPVPTLAELEGVDVNKLHLPPVTSTRFHTVRRQGWLRSMGGPYRIKPGLDPEVRRAKVEAEVSRLIADIGDFDATYRRCLAKTGAYEITLTDGALEPVRLLPKGSAELRLCLA